VLAIPRDRLLRPELREARRPHTRMPPHSSSMASAASCAIGAAVLEAQTQDAPEYRRNGPRKLTVRPGTEAPTRESLGTRPPLACRPGKAQHNHKEDDAYGCRGRSAWRPGRASWAFRGARLRSPMAASSCDNSHVQSDRWGREDVLEDR
jgi:hypothetical protein